MATEAAQQIDIWCNEDGLLTGNYVATELERIYDGDKIVKHDAATLIQPNGFAAQNGTLIIVISEGTLQQVKQNPSFSFANLKTSKNALYYVDEDDLLSLDRDSRFQCFGGKKWTRINTKNKRRDSLNELYRQIVQITLGDQTDTRRTPAPLISVHSMSNLNGGKTRLGGHHGRRKFSEPCLPTGLGLQPNTNTRSCDVSHGNGPKNIETRRGAFKIIPNTFHAGAKGNSGTIIISVDRIQWPFNGENVSCWLDCSSTKKKISLNLETEVVGKVYSFTLPDDLKAANYMLYVKDEGSGLGSTYTGGKLGNRSLKIQGRVTYISDNLFDEQSLADLCNVENLKTVKNLEAVDEQLSKYMERFQLPIVLPHPFEKEFPTLMHVACRFGLEKLCSRLIDSMCLPDSINIENKDGKRPCELARDHGHTLVADAFSNQLTIADLYVKCTSAEVRDFYDTYSTAPFLTEDSFYVVNPVLVDSSYDDCEDGQPVYDEISQGGRPPTIWNKPNRNTFCSEKPRGSAREVEPCPASSTLPRDMRLNGHQKAENHGAENGTGDEENISLYLTQTVMSIRKRGDSLAEKVRLQEQITGKMEAKARQRPQIAPRNGIDRPANKIPPARPNTKPRKKQPTQQPPARVPPPVPSMRPPSSGSDDGGEDYVEPIGTVPINDHRNPHQLQSRDVNTPPPVKPRAR